MTTRESAIPTRNDEAGTFRRAAHSVVRELAVTLCCLRMDPEITPSEFIEAACGYLASIEDFNGRHDACVRMQYTKEVGKSFEFIEAGAYHALDPIERTGLNLARPLITRVVKRIHRQLYGFASLAGLADHYRRCSGVKAYASVTSVTKNMPRGYFDTFEHSRSVWKFLEGGAPGLIQQKQTGRRIPRGDSR